jgi:hypothetical protein
MPEFKRGDLVRIVQSPARPEMAAGFIGVTGHYGGRRKDGMVLLDLSRTMPTRADLLIYPENLELVGKAKRGR